MFNKFIEIQGKLKVPKGQTNTFGNYKYRSCEDILKALQPMLWNHNLFLTINDEIIERGGRVYVRATARISDGKDSIETIAFAREPLEKKGMDSAQITGATSSYARKYALNGLFCIDDTKDADTTDNSTEQKNKAKQEPLKEKENPLMGEIRGAINEDINEAYKKYKNNNDISKEVKAKLFTAAANELGWSFNKEQDIFVKKVK